MQILRNAWTTHYTIDIVIIRALPLHTKCTIYVLAVFRLGFSHFITCHILPL